MKRIAIVPVLLFLSILVPLQAQDEAVTAQVKEVEGKVEYRNASGTWKPLRAGAILESGSMVSTGFKSTATLLIGEDLITVKPVTRLSLDELVKTGGGTRTKLFLTVGRVKAEVNPSKREHVEFSVRSATATASVRGTGFETDGMNTLVTHGLVMVENTRGQRRYVSGGEFTRVDSRGDVMAPVSVDAEDGLSDLGSLDHQTAMEQTVLEEVAPTGSSETSSDTVLQIVFQ